MQVGQFTQNNSINMKIINDFYRNVCFELCIFRFGVDNGVGFIHQEMLFQAIKRPF